MQPNGQSLGIIRNNPSAGGQGAGWKRTADCTELKHDVPIRGETPWRGLAIGIAAIVVVSEAGGRKVFRAPVVAVRRL